MGNKLEDCNETLRLLYRFLSGEQGTKRTAVVLNAGTGLYVSGKAASLADGIALAGQLIDSGRALAALDAFVAQSKLV